MRLNRRIAGLSVAAAFSIAAASAFGADADPAPMRILTFNIYHDWHVPDDGVAARQSGIERAIRKANPDVASLQEVSHLWWKSKIFRRLSQEYGIVRGDETNAVKQAGPPKPPKPGKPAPVICNPNPILYKKSRLELLDSGYDIFHIALGGTSKAVTWAVLEDKRSGRRFMAFSTHFWFKHNGDESDAIRELNARHILWRAGEARRKWGDIEVIGGGDLNCVQGSPALETFLREGYSNAMETAVEKTPRSYTRTYHGYPKRDAGGAYHGSPAPPGKDKPEQSIDHIFFTGGIQALKYDLDLDQKTLDSSDHSPVIVDFTFKEKESEPQP